jgi:hypothetical protein
MQGGPPVFPAISVRPEMTGLIDMYKFILRALLGFLSSCCRLSRDGPSKKRRRGAAFPCIIHGYFLGCGRLAGGTMLFIRKYTTACP